MRPIGQYWNGEEFSIGVNDCKKWGYEVDILFIGDSLNEYPDRKKVVEDSRPRQFLLGHEAWWSTHPSYKPMPCVYCIPHGTPWRGLEKAKLYQRYSSPLIAVTLAYSMGYDEIVLWGIDFANHPFLRGHRLKQEVVMYMFVQNELLKDKCSMYLGEVEGFTNNGALGGLIPNFLDAGA